ncbi:hypothetical protein HED52_17560 [Ochrobactrum ciceri]|uniref:Uncharacterized protein n=1 Tax=Brucella ciceri TaxID=391287 RepID=A0ABX1DZW9_9HYPH|nr:hypothetical protein [Brucella ciceri]
MGAKATRELDIIAEKARLRYLRARNMLILEAAISALLDTETPQDAAKPCGNRRICSFAIFENP